MTGEKVSIITISFNSEKTIEKTIKSILKQTYRPLEYVLVDGASKDNTGEIISAYIPLLKEAGIEVNYKSEPDKGISDAFNKGIQRASGSIIGITNADDVLLDDTIEFVAKSFGEDTDVFYGDCIWKDEERAIEYVRKSSSDLSDLRIRLKILHPAAYIRKTSYEKYGVYDSHYRYCMDKDLLARIQRMNGSFSYVSKPLAAVSAGGVSDKNLKGVMKEGKEIAINNGVPPILATIIFMKNYLVVKIKSSLKKNNGIAKIVEKLKR